MNPLNTQGLQGSPLTNPAAASSSGASSSSSTDEKITQVVSANESGPHQAVAASSQSLEGRKLSQENPPPVVLDLSSWQLSVSEEDKITLVQNSGGTITLLALGGNGASKELIDQMATSCPLLQEVELLNWEWKVDQLIQAQKALPKGVLLTNACYSIPNREELEKYLDYCAPFGGPTYLRLGMINDLTQSELDELIEGAPNLRYLNINSNQLTELNAPKVTWVDCSGCTGLRSISAPNALEIDCEECTGLQSLSAPKATRIDCWGCTSLQSISAPKATAIDFEECTSLQSLNVPLSAIEGWKEDPQLSLEMLQMGAYKPSPKKMRSLEVSNPELAQKMRKLTVLTLQDLAINYALGNPQVDKTVVPPGLFIRDDVETAYLARPESKTEVKQ